MGKTEKRGDKAPSRPAPPQNPRLAQQQRTVLRTHYAAKYRAR